MKSISNYTFTLYSHMILLYDIVFGGYFQWYKYFEMCFIYNWRKIQWKQTINFLHHPEQIHIHGIYESTSKINVYFRVEWR